MKRRSGFTLVELLVVIGIIALLISILIPAIRGARLAAKRARVTSDLRQMMMGYTQYHIENRGSVLYGYTPPTVNGGAVVVDAPSGHRFGSVVADRYPWRLVAQVSDIWRIIHNHTVTPPIPYGGEPEDQAFRDAYTLSINPSYGINSVYVGGHTGPVFQGFGGPNGDAPNVGRHVVFKASEVRRPSQLIVFAECQAKNIRMAGLNDNGDDGLHYLTPPYANGHQWTVENGQFKIVAPAGVLIGLPKGRNGDLTVTGFFDAHVESLRPGDLEDMRLWANNATSRDYDFVR